MPAGLGPSMMFHPSTLSDALVVHDDVMRLPPSYSPSPNLTLLAGLTAGGGQMVNVLEDLVHCVCVSESRRVPASSD